MKKNSLTVYITGGVIVAALAAFVLWNFVLGDTKEASAPIEAIPLASPISDPDPTTAPVATDDYYGDPTTEPEVAATTAPVAKATDTPEPVNDQPTLFAIVQSESEASFSIDEILRGSPKTVIGTTDQVAGQIAIDFANLANSQIGVIQINARTFATDDNRRNQAIRNRILHTDDFEFVTFTPTEIIGLSGPATVGSSFSFQIAGDLTIQDVTQPVIFDVDATAVSEQRIEGFAATVITLEQFGLVIPEVPFVASVSDEIFLEINFVATPAQ